MMSIDGALLVAQVHHDDLRRQMLNARGGRGPRPTRPGRRTALARLGAVLWRR